MESSNAYLAWPKSCSCSARNAAAFAISAEAIEIMASSCLLDVELRRTAALVA